MESEFLNLNEAFAHIKFHPVVHLPAEYEVLDFSNGSSPNSISKYSIGKYNEHRPAIYTSDFFGKPGEEHRDIHMGIDIGAPAATPVFSFFAGSVFCATVNSSSGDYGGWPPHLHFQLSLEEPKKCDMPGAVSNIRHLKSLEIFVGRSHFFISKPA